MGGRHADPADTAALARDRMLVVEPEVFEARAVVDAVDHQGQPLNPRLPAGRLTGVEDHRADIVLRQAPFNPPHQLPAFLPVRLHRLPVDQFVDLRIAIAAVVTISPAYVVLVEL